MTNLIHGLGSILSLSSPKNMPSTFPVEENQSRCLIPRLYRFHIYTTLLTVLARQPFSASQFAAVVWSVSQLMTKQWIQEYHTTLLSASFNPRNFIRTDKNILQLHASYFTEGNLNDILLKKLETYLLDMNDYQFIWTIWSLGKLKNEYRDFSISLKTIIENRLEEYCQSNNWGCNRQVEIRARLPFFRLLLMSLINLKAPMNDYSPSIREHFALGLQELLTNQAQQKHSDPI